MSGIIKMKIDGYSSRWGIYAILRLLSLDGI